MYGNFVVFVFSVGIVDFVDGNLQYLIPKLVTRVEKFEVDTVLKNLFEKYIHVCSFSKFFE